MATTLLVGAGSAALLGACSTAAGVGEHLSVPVQYAKDQGST